MDYLPLLFLFLAVAVSGFIGIHVGGGGLIAVPALLFSGLSPAAAIATDQLAILGVAVPGFIRYAKAKQIDYPVALGLTFFATIGAYVGARTLLVVPEELLRKLVGIVFVFLLLLLLARPKAGMEEGASPSRPRIVIGFLLSSVVGFWAAFFGAGFAFLGIAILVLMFGKTFLQSSATLTVMRFGVVMIAIPMYASNSLINWTYGIVMVLGCGLGSYFGAGVALKRGNTWLRLLLVIVVISSSAKLLFF